MLDPRVVYDNLEDCWSLLTCSNDNDLEGQFFDRKELPGSNDGIADYYNCFARQNDEGVCPFCGLLPIDNEFDPTREAFDHYLPRASIHSTRLT